MSFDSLKSPSQPGGGVFPRRALTISGDDPSHIQIVTVYLYSFNPDSSDQRLKIEFHKRSTTHELIDMILEQKSEGSPYSLLTLLLSVFAPRNADDFESKRILWSLLNGYSIRNDGNSRRKNV